MCEGVQDVPMVGSACLNSKRHEKETMVSVVADLRHASLSTTKFIAETLLLLEVCWLQVKLCACGLEYGSNDYFYFRYLLHRGTYIYIVLVQKIFFLWKIIELKAKHQSNACVLIIKITWD